jgi:hypothetical protein
MNTLGTKEIELKRNLKTNLKQMELEMMKNLNNYSKNITLK